MENITLIALLSATIWAIGIYFRIIIKNKAINSAVDEHYWKIAAQSYKEQKGLPVVIPGKYLLEDDTQAYPPLFGILIGRIFNKRFIGYVMPIIETLEFLILGAVLYFLKTPNEILIFALGVFVAAPVLVVYNVQITPRALGDFFLFLVLISQFIATQTIENFAIELFILLISAILISLLIMTHKMTLQLYCFLLPWWSLVLGSWLIPLFTLIGIGIYFGTVGWRFGRYQFKAHLDIVNFWGRHWRDLGAHQFLHSPLYGEPYQNRNACFHLPGWAGIFKHMKIVISYAPLNFLLPIASFISGVWPPAWVIVWFFSIYIWVFLTLFVPKLKCLGGGHLYIFNTIAPASIYIAFLPITKEVILIYFIGVCLIIFSLLMAYKVVRDRKIIRNINFDEVVLFLNKMKKTNLAVFPLQSAEAIAYETDHSVLWGGHGFGFRQLEGFFPVMKRPLSDFVQTYKVEWILWDSSFWRGGEKALINEGLLLEDSIKSFGDWKLAACKKPF